MKITKLEELDLSKYKIAWWEADNVHPSDTSQDREMKLAQGKVSRREIEIILVPKAFDLTLLTGDDWDDNPADCNAEGIYSETLPQGGIYLKGNLGGELALSPNTNPHA